MMGKQEIDGDIAAKVDPVFAEYDRPGRPGCAVGVVCGGQLVYGRGYGLANIAQGVPNGTRIAYNIGSESKQFTGACVALLIEQGLLGRADPINRFVPGIPFGGSEITIDHLVHHTSGLPDWWERAEAEGCLEALLETGDRDQVLRYALSCTQPDFEPGQACRYSNTGYLLLAAVVEKATAMDFRAFLSDAVLRPLGMDDTAVFGGRGMLTSQMSDAYREKPGEGFVSKVYWNYTAYGDGNIYSTVEDLSRWNQNLDEGRLGKGRFLEIMHSGTRLRDGSLCRYAFGIDGGQFGPSHWRGEAIYAHGGACGGFESVLLRIPGRRLAVILLGNTRGVKRKALDVADALLGGASGLFSMRV